MSHIDVLILMGSDSDAPIMQAAVDVLRDLGISSEMTVASAHRSPERVMADDAACSRRAACRDTDGRRRLAAVTDAAADHRRCTRPVGVEPHPAHVMDSVSGSEW